MSASPTSSKKAAKSLPQSMIPQFGESVSSQPAFTSSIPAPSAARGTVFRPNPRLSQSIIPQFGESSSSQSIIPQFGQSSSSQSMIPQFGESVSSQPAFASSIPAPSASRGMVFRDEPRLSRHIFPRHLFRMDTRPDGTEYIKWDPPLRDESQAQRYKRLDQERKVYGARLDFLIQKNLLDNKIDRALEFARLSGYSFTDPSDIKDPEIIPGFPKGGRSRRAKRKTHRKKANRRTHKRMNKRK